MTMTNDMLRQLKALAVEKCPEACLGCGYEHNCSVHGCAVINAALEMLEAGADRPRVLTFDGENSVCRVKEEV